MCKGPNSLEAETEPLKPPTMRNRFHSIAEFRPSEMRQMVLKVFDSKEFVSNKELDEQFDPQSKEPNKITKVQIKEYAKKYKHSEQSRKVEPVPHSEQSRKVEPVPWYKTALDFSQPVHAIAIFSFLYLAFRFFPDSRRGHVEASTLTRLCYISAISTVFGTQIWMTFFSGLSLFLTVPRHVFAQVQVILFPLYFLLISVLMLIAIVCYTQTNPTHLWNTHQCIQGFTLAAVFLVNLGIRLYLTPAMTKLITIKMAIEREAGMGDEIASSQPGRLSSCPHYMRLHRTFRRVHMTIAVGNILAMVGTTLHLYYLATKLCSIQI